MAEQSEQTMVKQIVEQSADERDTVIIAVDDSEHAEYAINYYLKRVHKAEYKVIFANVIELPPLKDAMEEMISPGKLQLLWNKAHEKGKEIAAKVKESMDSKEISDYKIETLCGTAGPAIVGYATEHKACMVVVGTRGMGTLRRTVMGSVSDYVVHHAHCPVVVCRK